MDERYSVVSVESDLDPTVDTIAEQFKALATWLEDNLPKSRELSLAQTNLETSWLYARRCVELNQDVL